MSELTSESTVYVIYIAATPEKIWAALTASDFTRQYFFGHSVESEWKQGSAWQLKRPGGGVAVHGEVRTSEPPRKLVLSWRVEGSEEMRKLPEAIVTYDIEPIGNGTARLTMTEAHPTPIPIHLLEGGRHGWPMILSNLKTVVETGKPLDLPTPQPSQKG